ncbi:MAG: glycoside hydrolase family 15 protein [Calditrichaceae bacterium]|nr:glycoside hydrolase family 15 protein [Calditrichaceae bacterium]
MNNLDYGVIGNCTSAALVSSKGSIDWCCLPKFDASSVFAKLLDTNKGGHFAIIVDPSYQITQQYLKNTNILCTDYKNNDDHFKVLDFMPRYKDENEYHAPPDIIRYIEYVSGKPKCKIEYNPQLEYAAVPTKTEVMKHYIKSYTINGLYDSLYLYTNLNKQDVAAGKMIELTEDAFLLVSYNQKIFEQTQHRINLELQRTKVYWLNWAEMTRKFAEYNEEITRSALVLKLLSYQKSGAILAALTTSVPETIGETRNWDYRFCWLRDSSMVIKVMSNLGHMNLARRYLNFIIDIIPDKAEKIQIMYGINREKKLNEQILDHLSGFKNSRPVRIGNDAYRQKQNDIYGILMDVLYQQFQLFDLTVEKSEALWTITRSIIRTVSKNWKKPDRGIWEFRSAHKHFTFSKILSWVAVDRAIKIANLIDKTEYIPAWTKLADQIRQDIHKNAWDKERGSFVQFYGSKDLDAANLLMEPYGFIDSNDPKYVSTVLLTEKELSRDGLMYRYKNEDDFGVPSSSFTICTFWMINSLNQIGQKDKAAEMFKRLLSYSNHVGLFSEDIDFNTKQLLGNFPQAYSHLALVETAMVLSNNAINKEEKVLEALH